MSQSLAVFHSDITRSATLVWTNKRTFLCESCERAILAPQPVRRAAWVHFGLRQLRE